MRRRSGGFHCETLEEFMQAMKNTQCFTAPHQMTKFQDRQSYLTEQSHLEPDLKDLHESFSFQEQHQLQVEEEEQLSSKNPKVHSTIINISMICQDLLQVRSFLLNPRQINETYGKIYRECLSKGKKIKSEVSHHAVILSSVEKIQNEKNHQKKNKKISQKIRNSLSKLSRNLKNRFFGIKQPDLQFVNYTDRVLNQGEKDYVEGNKQNVPQIQIKFWLIQQQETYSPLLQAYKDLADYNFKVSKAVNELNLSQIIIDAREEGKAESLDAALTRVMKNKHRKN